MLFALVAVGGCQSAGQPYRSSFYVYESESSSARLQDVDIVMEDGRALPLPDVLQGYEPFRGWIAPFINMDKIYISDRDIHHPGFIALLSRYDADANGLVEIPELTVLYAVESSRGLDQPATHIALEGRQVRALHTTAADLDGLRLFVKENRQMMTAETQTYFWMPEDMYQILLIRNNDLGHDKGRRKN
jgi:hypothetical protein